LLSISLPIFPLPFSVAVISHINFVLPCFPTLSFFVADFFQLPNFSVSLSSVAFLQVPFYFSFALFSFAVFAVNRRCM